MRYSVKQIIFTAVMCFIIFSGVLSMGLKTYNTHKENKEIDDKVNAYYDKNIVGTEHGSDDVYKPDDSPSDIEGLTVAEKIAKGLDAENGSDTDNDGLTDKEEIEVYGTDPLKMSTTGDFMSDSEKVKAGLDPLKKTKTKAVTSYPNNEVKAIEFKAESLEDANASAYEETGNVTLEGRKVYNVYSIANYGGKLVINAKNADNIAVYVCETFADKAKSVPFTVDGNKITLKKNFDNGKTYDVFIAEKKFTNGNVNVVYPAIEALKDDYEQNILLNAGVETKKIDTDQPDGFIVGSQIGTVFGRKLDVYYKKLSSSKATRIEMNNLIRSANRFSMSWSALTGDDIDTYIHEVDGDFIKNAIGNYRATGPQYEWKLNNYTGFDPYCTLIFFYMTYEQGNKINDGNAKNNATYVRINDSLLHPDEETILAKMQKETINCGFTDENRFSFPNPGYKTNHGDDANGKVKSHGICAGMALTMSRLFNGETPELAGTYTAKKAEPEFTTEWDLTNTYLLASDNLHDIDVNNKDFYADEINEDNLPDNEKQLLEYLHGEWAEVNDAHLANDKDVIKEQRRPSMDTVKKMIDMISDGKCVTVGFTYPEKGKTYGHAVNITAVTNLRNNKMWLFTGYDSNYPYDEISGVGKMGFIIKRSPDRNGRKTDTIEYYYGPVGISNEEQARLKDKYGLKFFETNTSEYKKGDRYGIHIYE